MVGKGVMRGNSESPVVGRDDVGPSVGDGMGERTAVQRDAVLVVSPSWDMTIDAISLATPWCLFRDGSCLVDNRLNESQFLFCKLMSRHVSNCAKATNGGKIR